SHFPRFPAPGSLPPRRDSSIKSGLPPRAEDPPAQKSTHSRESPTSPRRLALGWRRGI
ncbi:hypothetical protein B296_00036229, partial [Ensete ventricosum]